MANDNVPGTFGGTFGEAFRHACELRSILQMSPADRALFFTQVAKARGEAAAKQLQMSVWDEECRKK